jgi:hypothetical protein
MSKRMVDTFFPACLDRINGNRFLSFLYHDVVMPEAVAEQCPEYIWKVQELAWNIRQPALLLAAMWGITIGMAGFWQLRSTKFLWSLALLTFGFMNVSAVFVHCLWPAPSTDYPTDYPFLWVVDTYMTGVSGSCLLMASLQDLHERWITEASSSTARPVKVASGSLVAPGTIFQITMFLIQLIGLGCIAWFVLDPIPSRAAASHPLELWYLVPPILAGGPVLLVLYQQLWDSFCTLLSEQYCPTPKSAAVSCQSWFLSKSQGIFVSGVIAAGVVGIAMDRFWCPLVGYSLARDLLSANTMVFLGCDLAFWGIADFLLSKKKPKLS